MKFYERFYGNQEDIVSKAKLFLENCENEIKEEIVELILLKRDYKFNFKLSPKPVNYQHGIPKHIF